MLTLWTHSSTALEGNPLTLEETDKILGEGHFASKHAAKDDDEILGHAKAIEIMLDSINCRISRETLFSMHKAIQAGSEINLSQPPGSWRRESEVAWITTSDGKSKLARHYCPEKIPAIMEEWLIHLNAMANARLRRTEDAIDAYAALHVSFHLIRPFSGGNIKLAALLPNFPLLKWGLPPIIIAKESKQEYMDIMSQYQEPAEAETRKREDTQARSGKHRQFKDFIAVQWKSTLEMLQVAQKEQLSRIAKRHEATPSFSGARLDLA